MVVEAAHPLQGEVWPVDFASVVGREQTGRRPALVLSRDSHNRLSSVITVVPLTSSLTMRNHPASVFLPASSDGAKRDSLVLVFQVRAIDKARCERRLFRPREDFLDLVWAAMYAHIERPGSVT